MTTTGSSWAHDILPDNSVNGKNVASLLSKKFLSPDVRTKHVLPDEEWAHKIMGVDINTTSQGHLNLGSTSFCMCEARVYLEGSEIIAGVRYDLVPGVTYSDKRNGLYHMTVDNFSALLESTAGFIQTVSAHQCVLIPSGFIIVVATVEPTAYASWGVSSDEQGSSRTKVMINNMLTSYAELKGPSHCLTQFLRWLQEFGYQGSRLRIALEIFLLFTCGGHAK